MIQQEGTGFSSRICWMQALEIKLFGGIGKKKVDNTTDMVGLSTFFVKEANSP